MDRKIRYFVNGWSFRLSFATRPGYDGDHEDISDGDSYELGEYENSEEALAAAEAFISTHGNEVNDEEDGIGSVIYWTVEVERRVEYKENEWLPCDESGRIDDGYGNEPNATVAYLSSLEGSREVPPPMGKQYAILRVQKCKGAEIGAMQYHNDREPGKHTNPDIDQSRTRMNRELCPHADYEGEVQARIDAGYKGTRKVRKDAVRLVEGIVTASPEFFEGASAEEVRGFFEDALGFCREEFGESNLVHFTVHMDEETPHAHFGFVPLKDGKLSWKGFFPDKAALGAMQDRFYGRVGELYGLSRGEKRLDGQPARRHKSVAEYKAEQLETARAELASTRAQLADCRAQVESFAARFERIKAELAQNEYLAWLEHKVDRYTTVYGYMD